MPRITALHMLRSTMKTVSAPANSSFRGSLPHPTHSELERQLFLDVTRVGQFLRRSLLHEAMSPFPNRQPITPRSASFAASAPQGAHCTTWDI